MKRLRNSPDRWALTAALYDQITIKDGRVEQGNFDRYRMMLISEMPKVEVVLVPSGGFWGGIGEPGAPINGAVWVNSPAWPMASKMITDFDASKLAALNASGGELILFRPSPPTQAVIFGAGAGPRYTAGALDTAGNHTDSALDTAEQRTRKSLDASRRSVIHFLSGGKKKSTSR